MYVNNYERDRYARRRLSVANKFRKRRANAVSNLDSDIEGAQRHSDGILESNTDSQASDQVFREGTRGTEERPAPAAPIPIDALLALMQTVKIVSAGPKTDIRLPSFDDERNLLLFLKQFSDVAEANR